MNTTPVYDSLVLVFAITKHEFELPCDGLPKIHECDKAAKWQALFSCGCTRLWCDEHKCHAEEAAAMDKPPRSPAGTINCLTCLGWPMVRILILERLTGA